MIQEAMEVGGAQHQAGKSPCKRARDIRSWKSVKESKYRSAQRSLCSAP